MKKKINVISIVLFVLCIVSITDVIYDTYARYASSASGNAELNIATWKVLVNSQDISNGQTLTLTNYIDILLDDSDLVVSGKIAPNRGGSFEIEIDPRETEVAIEYNLTTSIDAIGAPSNASITGYQIKTGSGAYGALTTGTTVNNTIGLPGVTNNRSAMNSDQITTIKVFVKWVNDDNDNAEDTLYGQGERKSITVPVTLTVKQSLTQ